MARWAGPGRMGRSLRVEIRDILLLFLQCNISLSTFNYESVNLWTFFRFSLKIPVVSMVVLALHVSNATVILVLWLLSIQQICVHPPFERNPPILFSIIMFVLSTFLSIYYILLLHTRSRNPSLTSLRSTLKKRGHAAQRAAHRTQHTQTFQHTQQKMITTPIKWPIE